MKAHLDLRERKRKSERIQEMRGEKREKMYFVEVGYFRGLYQTPYREKTVSNS